MTEEKEKPQKMPLGPTAAWLLPKVSQAGGAGGITGPYPSPCSAKGPVGGTTTGTCCLGVSGLVGGETLTIMHGNIRAHTYRHGYI